MMKLCPKSLIFGRRYFPFFFCIFLLFSFFLLYGGFSPLWGELLLLGGNERGFGPLKLSGLIEKFHGSDASQDIRLKAKTHESSVDNLVYLDFEAPSSTRLKEKGQGLGIQSSLYFITKEAYKGKRAARFNAPEHLVRLQAGEEFGMGGEEAGDFTVEMWIKPAFFFGKTILFEKIAFLERGRGGQRVALQIGIEKGYLFAYLENLFQDRKGKRYSLRLDAPEKIKLSTWQHISFVYQAARGRVALYLNGREEDLRYARDKSQNWQLRFPSSQRAPLVIGKTFIGLMDEFRIARGALSPETGEAYASRYEPLKVDFQNQRGAQASAEVRSELLHLPKKKTARFSQISYKALEPRGTLVNVFVRSSKHRFDPDTTSLLWRRVGEGELSLASLRFFQWRAVLRSDPLGKHTPVLKSISLDYIPARPPPRPQGLRLVSTLSKGLQLCLEWEKSLVQEESSSLKGGYYIYYGLRPGEYMGALEFYQEGEEIKRLSDINETSHPGPLTAAEKQLQATTSGPGPRPSTEENASSHYKSKYRKGSEF